MFDIEDGSAHPLGTSVSRDGVNFSLFSQAATDIVLLLFDSDGASEPLQVIRFDPYRNKTFHFWHMFLRGPVAGVFYAFRVDGPYQPSAGHRFNPNKVLIGPYAHGISRRLWNRANAVGPEDNLATSMRCALVDPHQYDWEGDQPLRRPIHESIIYEVHAGGFTRSPTSRVAHRGTFAGIAEKISYLQSLGITAVELLPVFQFDTQDAPPGLVNYWGYAPVSFFAPHQGYSSRRDPLGAVDEFRDMVKALHRAGLEVFLDVVFNHTAEGDHGGPTLSFRGLDNPTYYILETDRSRYANYSGTGNTFNANHPIVRRMILDSLRYWVGMMHVDGFRFDLASILERDETGNVLPNPPVLWDIESDPALAGTKLIAEAWDAAGLYQVGAFVGDSWKEWNGRFRDDVRSFFRGEEGTVTLVADRLIGSPSLYGHKQREPEASVNFVTCHDGFTLNDLVSYDEKHNEANGEHDRDGADDNRSWNCGVEGPTDNPDIDKLRTRQVKNFLTVTMLSIGMPMMLMGDEVQRTQGGNNNAYCQDNETSWFDWTLLEKRADVHRFVTTLNARRVLRDVDHERQRVDLNQMLRQADITWHGVELDRPDWRPSSHSIAFTAKATMHRVSFHIILNAYWEPLEFELPTVSVGGRVPWRRWIDTFLDSPHDIVDWTEAPPVPGNRYRAEPRSVMVLFAGLG